MGGVKWRVSKVNNVSLEMVRRGKKQKPGNKGFEDIAVFHPVFQKSIAVLG